MRHRHALYLSDSMTKDLQLIAETHRVSKSAILRHSVKISSRYGIGAVRTAA